MSQGLIARILKRDRVTVFGMIREHESQYRYNAKFRTLFDAVTGRLNDKDLVVRFNVDEVFSGFR